MSHFEKDAIISGLGISRIGRKTGIPGLELTMEAARAAIDDAGLTPRRYRRNRHVRRHPAFRSR